MTTMIKVLLPASMIPVGSTVTKRTGEKEYQIVDKLRIFGPENERKELNAADGCRFLTTFGGDTNMVSRDTILGWNVDAWKLRNYLDDYLQGTPQ